MRASASGPLTRSSTEVRRSSSRTSGGWRSSTSASRYAGHGPLAAGELAHEALRVGMPGERDRRQPQAGRPSLGALVQQRQPLVGQRRPRIASSSSRASSSEKRRSAAAQLVQLAREPQPMQPEPRAPRAWPARRAAAAAAGRGTARATARASAEHSSCRSSITSTTGSSSDRSSDSSRSTTASPWKAGDGLTRSTSPSPPTAPDSASTTDSQNRCASRSPRSTDTHATRPPARRHRPTSAAARSCRCPQARTPRRRRPAGVRQEMEQWVAPDQPAFAGSMVRPGAARGWRSIHRASRVLPAGASQERRVPIARTA